MKIYDQKCSFAGGELSPLLHARVDLAQYAIGARRIENFIVLPQGGVTNRPGTTQLSGPFTKARLVPFIFSEDDSLCLVFHNDGVDVYSFTGFRLRIDASNYYPDNPDKIYPYTVDKLSKLRWLQSGDVIYLFHSDVPVHTLSRYSDGDWRFEEVAFKNGPFQDYGLDHEASLRWSLDAQGNALYYVEGEAGAFTPDMVGLLLKLETKIPYNSTSFGLGDGWPSEHTVYNVFGPYTITTSGDWSGTIWVEICPYENWKGRDEADWEWEPFKEWRSHSGDKRNYSISGDIETYATHFRFTEQQAGMTISLSWEGGIVERIFKIVEYLSSSEIRVELPHDADLFHTEESGTEKVNAWAPGAFGPTRGYPSLGIFHQERLVLAGTKYDIQTLWMSKSASWHDFGTSIPTRDDDSITVTLASKEVNEIRGLASRGDLLILTSGGEWTAKAGSKSDVFTPGSIIITPSGYRGSEAISPLEVGSITMFVQRHGKVVRSLGYSLEVDGYTSTDLTVMSEHIFENNPIVAWGYQQTPWSVVWVALRDGMVAAFTMQQEHQVNAWARQDFSGRVKDVCCIPGTTQDDVFFLVERNGELILERLKHRDFLSENTFKDSDRIPVVSTLETLEWEQQVNGTLQGRHKFIPTVTMRLHKTHYLKAGVVTENNETPRLDIVRFPGEAAPNLYHGIFTGDARLEIPGGTGRTCRLRVMNDAPGPVTILGVFPELEVDDGSMQMGNAQNQG